jgi:uncharacterized protein (DUF4415 family)
MMVRPRNTGCRPFLDVFPAFRDSVERVRGRPPQDNPKQQITLRLDAEIIRHDRASGKGWQSRINADLRKLVGADQPD